MNFLKKLKSNEDGATAIEYALIAALIAIAIIAGANLLGGSINSAFSNVAGTVANPTPAAGE